MTRIAKQRRDKTAMARAASMEARMKRADAWGPFPSRGPDAGGTVPRIRRPASIRVADPVSDDCAVQHKTLAPIPPAAGRRAPPVCRGVTHIEPDFRRHPPVRKVVSVPVRF
jgi:hypothetical protein